MIKSKNNLYMHILEETSKSYIKDYKDDIIYFLNKYKIQELLQTETTYYSPATIVDCFLPFLQDLLNINSEEWLELIYNFTLRLSFPEKVSMEIDPDLEPICYYFLNLIRYFSKYNNSNNTESFLYHYPMIFLDKEEEESAHEEYFYFKTAYTSCYIYELMLIDMDLTGHNTIEHLVGVNHLSMFISRQLKDLGLPIDLGVVVGASLAHDIGKYGVLDIDKKRVPYYHYYYSNQWYQRFNMPHIGHIASNHSTWDLELENLPLESLVLIYSDFRIKNKYVKEGYRMNIFNLDDSYEIILNKLDNLDEAKENRYDKVYRKLKDFENYMHYLGVNTNPQSSLNPFRKNYHEVFMNSHEIVSSFKFLAIENNIQLMNKLISDAEFNSILERVRSEYNWRRLRVYLQILTEYSTYLTKRQKKLLIQFLLDLLFHREEDIRKESALLMGVLISDYDEEYRKEIPPSIKIEENQDNSVNLLKKILDKILFPDPKFENSHIDWQYNLKSIIKSLFSNSSQENSTKYVDLLIKYYNRFDDLSYLGKLYLAQTIKYLPYEHITNLQKLDVYDFIEKLMNSQYEGIRLTILDIIDEIYEVNLDNTCFNPILNNWLKKNNSSEESEVETYLKYKLSLKLKLDPTIIKYFKKKHEDNQVNMSNIFLNNLKTATDWMEKKVNIDILYDEVLKNPKGSGLHTGMHFCNLLKVSEVEKVRNYAGHTLINIFPYLSIEEKNDIVIELLRALEMQNYQFTKYIPKYLGRAILRLEASEISEILDDLEIKIKTSNIQTSFLILQLAGYSLEYISEYNENDKKVFESTLNRFAGIILIGMASYQEDIKMEALRILSNSIFNSNKLVLEDKYYIFNIIAKKILVLLPKDSLGEFILLNNSSSFNHIYRFIIDFEFEYGELELDIKTKYAFFPGSFDPFTNGHKEIVKNIRDLGFEVYLAIDEFSWSKRTQPHDFRKDIINISLANEKDIFIFPGDIPINISNNKDLENLESIFESKPYIVIGLDVLINASAYKKDKLITDFPHIIVDRKYEKYQEELLEDKLKLFSNELVFLDIDEKFQNISSTKIRNRIDLERDVSDKIDPLASRYIQEHGLYLKEPEYKTEIESKTIEYKVFSLDTIPSNDLKEIIKFSKNDTSYLSGIPEKKDLNILVLKNSLDKTILGISLFYKMNNHYFLDEFDNTDISSFLRENIRGSTLLISYIYSPRNFNTTLNETLLYSIHKGFNHAIIKMDKTKDLTFPIESIISHGFISIPYTNNTAFIVDMNDIISFSENIEIFLKPPFNNNLDIKNTIEKNRVKVKQSIASIFPGQLILSISRDMLYSQMIEKICFFNKVESKQLDKRELGRHLCVPFGDILNNTIIPNTVTKTLHTEKVFEYDLKSFSIDSFPNYLSIQDQIRVLNSFDRPIILVDDILHKGHRLKSISPYLHSEKLDIQKVIVGILSGRGLEIAKKANIDIDSAYFIPNLKVWFDESNLIPFIGGNTVDVKRENHLLIPSINFILPYAYPRFLKSNSQDVYNFSNVILKSSIDLFQKIEEVYQEKYGKNLLIRNLGKVLTIPRKPDKYTIRNYSSPTKPSQYLLKDLNQLNRINL